MTNVLAWSHRLHHDTIEALKQVYGEIKVTEILYHSEDRMKVPEEVDAILDDLKAQGVLEGRVAIALPSLSLATSLVTIGVFRETGIFPDLVNLMQDADGRYRPSRSRPVISGQRFGDRRRAARKSVAG